MSKYTIAIPLKENPKKDATDKLINPRAYKKDNKINIRPK